MVLFPAEDFSLYVAEDKSALAIADVLTHSSYPSWLVSDSNAMVRSRPGLLSTIERSPTERVLD